MKKLLLLVLVVSFGFSVSAHQLRQNLKTYSMQTEQTIANAPEKTTALTENLYRPVVKGEKGIVEIIDIGTSANAYSYGYGGGQKSILAYNAEINTVTHIHRMGGTMDPGGYSGDIGYDISTDGGQTFTNMVECYIAENNSGGTYYSDAARYPNHGIYNPAGNTDPANAYVTFYLPTLDGTNSPPDSWGGHAYGVSKIGDPSYTTKTLVSSNPGDNIYRYIPDAYTVTNSGDAWVVDINQDWSTGSLIYTGYLLVGHGTWNSTENDFVFDYFLLDCPVTEELVRPSQSKIEFAPDGQTGYIAILGDNDELDFSAGAIYPILWKTTDGGQTWGDPIEVEMGGPEGIPAIHWYMTEAEWQSFWAEPYPEREEVKFTTAFDFDLSVDINGNPHIAVGVGVASLETNYSIYTTHPFYCISDIYSPDGGITWDAHIIDKPKQFRSNFDTEFTEDSRTQIARNHSGTHIFVSYMDTHLEGEEHNDYPDIMCRGINVLEGTMTEQDSSGILLNKATNVTNLSDGMWQAYYMVMSNEVIEEGSNHIIPFTYEELNIANVGDPVQYKYVQNFTFAPGDYTFGIGTNEIEQSAFNVSQNYPNPFNGQTEITVTLSQNTNVSVEVFNLMGQKVYGTENNANAGTQTFTIQANDLQPGVYFYSVTANNKTISKKMIVE
ncbi:MAG: T9SS type A sorting domain-containing protein [Bacteroidales bacterium]|nr:T9SS type A sorting domain-containing protein [Bacteroidales bacterium]